MNTLNFILKFSLIKNLLSVIRLNFLHLNKNQKCFMKVFIKIINEITKSQVLLNAAKEFKISIPKKANN